MLRVMIVDNDLKRSKSLKNSLLDNGFDVIAHVEDDIHLQTKCCELTPDVVIIDTESPSRDSLDNVYMIAERNMLPVVMFTQDSDKEALKAATKAGVSGYVVGTVANERLTPVIEAAVARFEETKQLRDELDQANVKLGERKIVERAKGILMRQRNLGEDEAYKMLRNMAMKKNMKLADLSYQLIDTAEMLIV
ncbi:MAG: ANTAR domain-containing response regulator [Methylophilaceae bacterium]